MSSDTQVYELTAEYDSANSFYRKALVHVEGHIRRLQSYNTIVAEIDTSRNIAIVFGTYSATTLRHIKEFLKQHSFKAETLKQVLEDYGARR